MKKILWLLLFGIVTTGGLFVWDRVQDLQHRFPDMDFKRIRFGIASWYSETDRYINEKTASGESFDDEKITCASWNHAFGEKLLVINLFNWKWTVCRVNDRGPNKRLHREIDLSKAAFKEIANPRRGLILAVIIPTVKKNNGKGF